VTDANVNASDDIAARNDIHTTVSDPATLANPHDYNRDSKVNGTDEIFDRGHHTNGNGIFLITPSTPGVFANSVKVNSASSLISLASMSNILIANGANYADSLTVTSVPESSVEPLAAGDKKKTLADALTGPANRSV
jgi:hypothetical protein